MIVEISSYQSNDTLLLESVGHLESYDSYDDFFLRVLTEIFVSGAKRVVLDTRNLSIKFDYLISDYIGDLLVSAQRDLFGPFSLVVLPSLERQKMSEEWCLGLQKEGLDIQSCGSLIQALKIGFLN